MKEYVMGDLIKRFDDRRDFFQTSFGKIASNRKIGRVDFDDLFQEFYLKLLKKSKSSKTYSIKNLDVYLIGSFMHFCLDYHRSNHRKKDKESYGVNPPEDSLGQDLSSLEVEINREKIVRVYDAHHRLKPLEREAVILHYFQGKSYIDCGEALGGVPIGTVSSRLNRALRNLKGVLS